MEQRIVGDFIDASVGNHEEAARLLKQYPRLREATWFGDDPVLTFLVIENFPAGVEFCLKNGFDPNRPHPTDEDSPLLYACLLNYPEVVKILIRHGADPNTVSLVHDTPLRCCVSHGAAELVDLLIAYGADPHYTTALGETVFDNWPSSADKRSALAKVLRKHGVTPRKS